MNGFRVEVSPRRNIWSTSLEFFAQKCIFLWWWKLGWWCRCWWNWCQQPIKGRAHLREIMSFLLNIRRENDGTSWTLNLSMRLREAVDGQLLTGLIAKYYVMESMFPIPTDEPGQTCLRKMIYRIHPDCILWSWFCNFGEPFCSQSWALASRDVKAAQVKSFKAIRKPLIPFMTRLVSPWKILASTETLASNTLNILREIKSLEGA